jgi:hypothetical protein
LDQNGAQIDQPFVIAGREACLAIKPWHDWDLRSLSKNPELQEYVPKYSDNAQFRGIKL